MDGSESSNKKVLSSVHDISAPKPPFGSRFLKDDSDVWSQNAWDHVPPPRHQEETIASSLAKQRLASVPPEEHFKYHDKPARHWDNFYKMNSSNFFRNRKWLHNEFPDLVTATQPDAGPVVIAEVGCGAGNSVFPLLSANKNPALSLHAYDYSTHAVKLVQTNPLYASPPAGSIHASVWDVTTLGGLPADLEPGSVDIVILVFVLSALHPDEWRQAINNIYIMLRPGGLVFLRDYGRYDLTQLRFKSGRMLDENFYIRGDKTRVYFFELNELSLLFTGSISSTQLISRNTTQAYERDDDGADDDSGSTVARSISDAENENPARPTDAIADRSIHPKLVISYQNGPAHPLFATEQLGIDRRMIVNRKRQLKMYRVWMQGKFRKL